MNVKMKKMRSVLFVCLFVFAFAGVASGAEVLRMATTTSTDNTGLLDYLAPLLLQEKNSTPVVC